MWPSDFADIDFVQYKISHKLKAVGSLAYKPEGKDFLIPPPPLLAFRIFSELLQRTSIFVVTPHKFPRPTRNFINERSLRRSNAHAAVHLTFSKLPGRPLHQFWRASFLKFFLYSAVIYQSHY